MNKTAIVVGSGFGGISAALGLKSLGYEVSIYEKLNQLGEEQGYLKNLDLLLMLAQQ